MGIIFLEEIKKSIHLIKENHERYPFYDKDIHKFNIRRFPYSIFYGFKKELDKIIILTVAHQKRKPNYWRDRI